MNAQPKPNITYAILSRFEPGPRPEIVPYAAEYQDGRLNRAYPISNPHEASIQWDDDIKALLDKHADEETYACAFDLEPRHEEASHDLPF